MDMERKPIAPIPKRLYTSQSVPFSLATNKPKSYNNDHYNINPFGKVTASFEDEDTFELTNFQKECEEQENIRHASDEILNILKSKADIELDLLSTDGSELSSSGHVRRPAPRQKNPFLRNFENKPVCVVNKEIPRKYK
jgi:hypothetical protein